MPSLLLITGIPGTGKTEAGRTLAARHGFVHLDAEDHARRQVSSIHEWVALWEEFLALARELARQGKNVVVTWGFMPGLDNITVRALQGMGFQMIWFDGDRVAARREFLRRGTVPEAALNEQMAKIARLDLQSFAPISFDPFDQQGTFLEREEISRRLLALG